VLGCVVQFHPPRAQLRALGRGQAELQFFVFLASVFGQILYSFFYSN
jgi:hypothetical protein